MSINLMNLSADPSLDTSAGIIDERNYATNKAVVDQSRQWPIAMIDPIRTQRRQLTEKWLRYEMLWQSKHTVRLYKGRHDVYVPRAQKVIETHVANTVTKLFPLDERYTMSPLDEFAEQRAEIQRPVMDHLIDESPLRTQMTQFTRRGYMLGTSIFKSYWHVKKTRQFRREPTMPFDTPGAQLPPGTPSTMFVQRDVMQYEGPRPQVIDLLRWYIHPITIQDIDDYEIIFEDMDVDMAHLTSMADRRKYSREGVKKLIKLARGGAESRQQDQITSDRDQRLSAMGFTVHGAGIKDNRFKLTEIWVKFPLYQVTPGPDGKRHTEPIPCRMVYGQHGSGDPIPLFIGQNPLISQRPPYRAWRVRDMMDNFYGQGLLETLEALQYALNAFFAQALDSATFTINQLAVVDVMKLATRAKDVNIAPLSVISVRGDPEKAIRFWSPPDVSQVAIQIASMLGSLMEDESGATPIRQGKAAGGRQTAKEIGVLQLAASTFEDAAVDKIESEAMNGLLKDWFLLAQQYLSPATFERITKRPKEMDPVQSLVGDYDMRWAVSRTARKREAMELEQVNQNVLMQQLQVVLAQLGQQGIGSQAAPQPGASAPAPAGAPSPFR